MQQQPCLRRKYVAAKGRMVHVLRHASSFSVQTEVAGQCRVGDDQLMDDVEDEEQNTKTMCIKIKKFLTSINFGVLVLF